MTLEQFSNEFDVLISAYITPTPFGTQDNRVFDEYEKSVFLTQAQEQLLTEFYTGYNTTRDSYEKTEQLRKYLNNVTETKVYYGNAYIDYLNKKNESGFDTDDRELTTDGKGTPLIKLVKESQFFPVPDNLWFATYEQVELFDPCNKCINGSIAVVKPVSQDEFKKTYDNSFRGPSKTRVLRLDIKDQKVELVPKYTIGKYLIRYMEKPTPIILTDLEGGVNIKGESKASPCKLNDAIHREILERAVQLALSSRAIYANQNNE